MRCPESSLQAQICKISFQNETHMLRRKWVLHSGLRSQVLWEGLGWEASPNLGPTSVASGGGEGREDLQFALNTLLYLEFWTVSVLPSPK